MDRPLSARMVFFSNVLENIQDNASAIVGYIDVGLQRFKTESVCDKSVTDSAVLVTNILYLLKSGGIQKLPYESGWYGKSSRQFDLCPLIQNKLNRLLILLTVTKATFICNLIVF